MQSPETESQATHAFSDGHSPGGKPSVEFAIQVHSLRKSFKSTSGLVDALQGVTFQVPREAVFTILGPNGAGKTTLLKILTTVMRPTSGTAKVEGFEITRQNIHIRQLIGIVAQQDRFDHYLNVWQNLVLHAQMHGMEKRDYESRISTLLEQVGLYERRYDSMDGFSGGMQRRVSLIRALIHQPKLLFLDEPTTGLDPAARRALWDTIVELKRNTTVILTTHYMEEADRLSDQILILNHGNIVMTGTAAELKNRISPPDTYELSFNQPMAQLYLEKFAPWIHNAVIIDGDLLRFKINSLAEMPQLIAEVAPSDLKSFSLAQVDLETVYLSVAGAKDARTAEYDLPHEPLERER